MKSRFLQIAADTFRLRGPVLRFQEARTSGGQDEAAPGEPSGEGRPTDPVAKRTSPTRNKRPKAAAAGSKTRRTLNDVPQTGVRLDRFSCLPFPDGAAQTIVCEGTLPYVPSPDAAVAELHRTLATDGYLLLRLENPADTRDIVLWRPSPQGLAQLLAPFDATVIAWEAGKARTSALWSIACKGDTSRTFARDADRFIRRLQTAVTRAAGDPPARPGRAASLFRRVRQWIEAVVRSQGRNRANAGAAESDTSGELQFMVDARYRDRTWLEGLEW